MNAVRIFFVGGYLAYRALFNWIHWTMYVPTMLGGPIFQILFFAYIGRYAGSQSDKFFLVGNAVAICALGVSRAEGVRLPDWGGSVSANA